MKKIFYVSLAVTAFALCVSCATTHYKTFDKEIPKEQTVQICFGDGVLVKTYNGIDVHEDWYGKTAWSNERVKATLPAGDSEFGFDLMYVTGNQYSTRTYSAKNLTLKYKLEAGKKYSVFFQYDYKAKSWGLALYDNLPVPVLRWKTGKVIKFWPMDF